jgi:hypothetical protein
MRGNYWRVEKLLGSQEGLCCSQLLFPHYDFKSYMCWNVDIKFSPCSVRSCALLHVLTDKRTEPSRTPVLHSAGCNSSDIFGRTMNPPPSMLRSISRLHIRVFFICTSVRKAMIGGSLGDWSSCFMWSPVINFNWYNVNKTVPQKWHNSSWKRHL